MKEIAVAPLSDGRLQIWAIGAQGGILSSRKVNAGANADWTDLDNFLIDVGPLPAAAAHVAVAPLSDGRLELWVTLADGRLFTAWQNQTDPVVAWTGWTDFLAVAGSIPTGVAQVAVARLPDGRLQLWATAANGHLFTSWKTQTDPNAGWTAWSDFQAEVGAVQGGIPRRRRAAV